MPATIIQSEVAIYSDSACTTRVGNTIVTNSAATAITADINSLGVTLAGGTNYWAKARCTNSESYVSAWTDAYNFKTLIDVSINSITGIGSNNCDIDASAIYSNAVSVSEIGYKYSTSADGSNAVTVQCPDQQAWEQYTLTGLQEHTTYYIIPYVLDNLNRSYQPSWDSAEQITTTYAPATATINSNTTTYNSITTNVTLASTTSITNAYVTIQAEGGTLYKFDLTNTTGAQSVTFTDGATDSNGTTISISPNTTYTVVCSVTNSAGTATATGTATTAAQQVSAVEISSITNITPNSATINLSFA